MRLYFRFVYDNSILPDSEGQEFTDLENAKSEAAAAIRELVVDAIKSGQGFRLDSTCQIVNETNDILAQVTFAEALSAR